ncbi:Xylulose kinase [Hartmannibacter diazotrophicus]|uniref:Xylulose kinase n=1 Tax=Hartmannibacter diazotrophicus TaxID=1482074 RepID=A0A2C9D4X9_9HYPH|nr:xylulokinase [Hartmannibacter diazotrophicus]SON54821.1 Xylulose kinase [Hartmannibacter diazotrophicus]
MYIGIDIGTSSVKSVLIGDDQAIVASASVPLEVSRPHSGWSEQNPGDWVSATFASLDELARTHPKEMSAVTGIGLSGQMHGATLLGADDKPLRPAILWNDVRSSAECAELEARCPTSRDIAGNIAMPGFTAPKLLWVKNNEPEVFAQVRKVLLPKDYVRLHLVGDYVSDMSDAAGTLWLDVKARAWSDALLAATHLTRDHMPWLVEGTDVSGRLKPDLAARFGMAGQPVVAGGGGDNAASAIGMGTVTPGAAFASLGTSGVLFVSNDRFSPNTHGAVHAFCHALPDTWHQMGVILSATDSLNWLSGLLKISASDLAGALGDKVTAPSPVLFLPYLSGERTPHNDAAVRGAFVGLAHQSDAATMTQAVLEGVAFAFADCLRVLGDAGTTVPRAAAIGGGSRSNVWLQIMANVLGVPLDVPRDGDFGGAFGAARLGLIAATGADPLSIATPPPTERTIDPEPALVAAYADRYARYRAFYPAVHAACA